MKKLTGSQVALVTPMNEDGSIDWDATTKLIEWHIASGTDVILAVGTTGESPTLTHQEHNEFVTYVVEKVGGRIPVIAGAGSNSTIEAIELSQHAQKCGADAALSVVPYYNKPTQSGLVKHFAEIAKNADIPQLLYNVPSRTITDLLPETVAEIAEYKNIIGIKEASGDVSRVAKLRSLCGENFIMLSGDDYTCCDFILAGGDGCMSVTANIAPTAVSRMCHLAMENKADEARKLQESIMPIHEAMYLEPNPIPVKYALFLKNRIKNAIRLPLTNMTDSHIPELERALKLLESI
ncbi:MAG: 4-hydroxy-tetrahydrodipicolinate synthase [Gammaproteobacteria bacterium]|nr:4-hydroxy-tetrahydrodipicolinate synthase [Gammaproteobacteria bacterium]